MELELQWDGNPSVILDIKTRLGVALPLQVKDIGFTGVFMLIFKPLVEEFPGFGAISYSLRQKKKLDLTLKVVGGDISSIPGLYEAIEVVNESLDPVRNQTFDFLIEDGLHDMLILEVWDHDTFGKDYMGRCISTLTRAILEDFEICSLIILHFGKPVMDIPRWR